MKNIRGTVSLLAALLFFAACKDRRSNTSKSQKTTCNFIILLDLSDRILVRDQPKIDKELVSYIYSLFEEKVRENIAIYSKDKFKIAVAEQRDFPVDQTRITHELNFNIGNVGGDDIKSYEKKRNYIVNFRNNFEIALNELYKETKVDTSSEQFKGSDIWKYFNQNLELDCITDDNVKNYLFVLTDGYFDFEDYKSQKRIKNRYSTSYFFKALRKQKEKWEEMFDKGDYGFLPINKDFRNTSVLVLEVNPKIEFIDEFSLLQKTWGKWLEEMNITHKTILKKNTIETTKEQIKEFVEAH